MHDLATRLKLDLTPGPRAARCMLCNELLREAAPGEVEARVPERTRRAFHRFWRCPGCERVYWQGSHWRRLQRQLGGTAAER